MSVQRIASRYAKSLIELSQEQGKLEQTLEDVRSFKKATENRDFYLLLKSPVVSTSKKLSILDAIFQGKYDELTMAFLRILVNKGREMYLPEIADEFIDQYKKLKHISTVTVRTATPLSEATLEQILAKLKASKATDDEIELIAVIDPSLIGGIVLEFDDQIYDASIAHKLDKMHREFGDNLYISKIVA
ncbi:ATP synthase F1 subunit delta [Flavilitoribacter nigricans]|uniref:ATP synthase subunit delta n=1 Tax=Flavilitoribacter nigricans (strain ATCC 23147 / DSM 23189 / NBRC 102662 / NCIMB 1420 / SS-2) TaxID=1122177 RepID=A0A2D0N5A3_FLAN2|nr:ATP synthase F1 subunit delta [Flavilitoribacter nigricans]PHN03578.1 ATP synthase F1 subunit delta [Flavilitoribacter nigricans DSM 23189 = NBRC 102662]